VTRRDPQPLPALTRCPACGVSLCLALAGDSVTDAGAAGPASRVEPSRRFLNCAAAAKYLGFQTAAGIRALVQRKELVPDGRGYRGGYVFTPETLDAFVRSRLARSAPPVAVRPQRRVSRRAAAERNPRSLRDLVANLYGTAPPKKRAP
jgi:hypothetical protein